MSRARSFCCTDAFIRYHWKWKPKSTSLWYGISAGL